MVVEVSGIAELAESGPVVTDRIWEVSSAVTYRVVTPVNSVFVEVMVPLLIVLVEAEQEKEDD